VYWVFKVIFTLFKLIINQEKIISSSYLSTFEVHFILWRPDCKLPYGQFEVRVLYICACVREG